MAGCSGHGNAGSGRNIAIGKKTGWRLQGNAQDNIFLGCYAGCDTCSGCNNIAIGRGVNPAIVDGSNQLAIGIGTIACWIVGNANFNVGIGTTNPDLPVGAGNTNKLSVGILSAYQLYGDGSNLTGS